MVPRLYRRYRELPNPPETRVSGKGENKCNFGKRRIRSDGWRERGGRRERRAERGDGIEEDSFLSKFLSARSRPGGVCPCCRSRFSRRLDESAGQEGVRGGRKAGARGGWPGYAWVQSAGGVFPRSRLPSPGTRSARIFLLARRRIRRPTLSPPTRSPPSSARASFSLRPHRRCSPPLPAVEWTMYMYVTLRALQPPPVVHPRDPRSRPSKLLPRQAVMPDRTELDHV